MGLSINSERSQAIIWRILISSTPKSSSAEFYGLPERKASSAESCRQLASGKHGTSSAIFLHLNSLANCAPRMFNQRLFTGSIYVQFAFRLPIKETCSSYWSLESLRARALPEYSARESLSCFPIEHPALPMFLLRRLQCNRIRSLQRSDFLAALC